MNNNIAFSKKHVFVSPHFDDAVGSCACLIKRLVKKGIPVSILTVFAEGTTGEKSAFAKDFLDFCGMEDGILERRVENHKACSYLKVKEVNFHFIDAIFRKTYNDKWIYHSFDALFGEINKYDLELIHNIYSEFQNTNILSSDTIFFFPSAKGGHVDHKIVYQVGMKLSADGYKVVFYDEFFYNYNNDYMNNFKAKAFFFSEKEAIAKTTALGFYQSQHKLLFQGKSISSFINNFNKKNDKWFELYFFPQ